jgi:hypothetical protein
MVIPSYTVIRRLGWREWPSIDPSAAPDLLFQQLSERSLAGFSVTGYFKDKPARRLGLAAQVQSLPFEYSPDDHRALFIALIERQAPTTRRAVFEAYFSSLFTAWRNYSCPEGTKQWVVGFRNRLRHNIDQVFADFSNGRFITCVRDAKARTASNLRYHEGTADTLSNNLAKWREVVAFQLATKKRYGDRVAILTFDQLVLDTEVTMRRLADWLGISFHVGLLTPTFNGAPIRANSSFRVEAGGIIRAPLDNWRSVLSQDEAAFVDHETSELYGRVRAAALR